MTTKESINIIFIVLYNNFKLMFMKKIVFMLLFVIMSVNALAAGYASESQVTTYTDYSEKTYVKALVRGMYIGSRDYEKIEAKDARLTKNADGSYAFAFDNLIIKDSVTTWYLGAISADGIKASTNAEGTTILTYDGDITVGAGSDTSVKTWMLDGLDLDATIYAEVYSEKDIYMSMHIVTPGDSTSLNRNELIITYGEQRRTFTENLTIEIDGQEQTMENKTVLLTHEPGETYSLYVENIVVPNIGGIGTLVVEGITATDDASHTDVISLGFTGRGTIIAGTTEGTEWKYAGESLYGRFSGKIYNSDESRFYFNIVPFEDMDGKMIGVEFGKKYPNTEYYTSNLKVYRITTEASIVSDPTEYTVRLTDKGDGTYDMELDDLVITTPARTTKVGSIAIKGITATKSQTSALVDTLSYTGDIVIAAGSGDSTSWTMAGDSVSLTLSGLVNADEYLFVMVDLTKNEENVERTTIHFGNIAIEYEDSIKISVDGVAQPATTGHTALIEEVGGRYSFHILNLIVGDEPIGTISIYNLNNIAANDTMAVFQYRGKANVYEGIDTDVPSWSMAGEETEVYFYAEQHYEPKGIYASLVFVNGDKTVNVLFGENNYAEEIPDTLKDVINIVYQGKTVVKNEIYPAIARIPDDLSHLMGLTLENLKVDSVGGIGTIKIDSIALAVYPTTDVVYLTYSGNAKVEAGNDPEVSSWKYANQILPITISGQYFLSSGKIHVVANVGDEIKVEYGKVHSVNIKYTDDIMVEFAGNKNVVQQMNALLALNPIYDTEGVLTDTLATLTLEDLWITGIGGVGTLIMDSMDVATDGNIIRLKFDGTANVENGNDPKTWWYLAGKSYKGEAFGEMYEDTRKLYFELVIDDMDGVPVHIQYGTKRDEITDKLSVTLNGNVISQEKEVTLLRKPDQTCTLEIKNLQIEGIGNIGTVTIENIGYSYGDNDVSTLTYDGNAVVTAGDDPTVSSWMYAGQTIPCKLSGEMVYSQEKLHFSLTLNIPSVGEVPVEFGSITTNIKDNMVSGDNATVKEIYSLSGTRSSRMRKGVNIVRMSDGTVKKIVRDAE